MTRAAVSGTSCAKCHKVQRAALSTFANPSLLCHRVEPATAAGSAQQGVPATSPGAGTQQPVRF